MDFDIPTADEFVNLPCPDKIEFVGTLPSIEGAELINLGGTLGEGMVCAVRAEVEDKLEGYPADTKEGLAIAAVEGLGNVAKHCDPPVFHIRVVERVEPEGPRSVVIDISDRGTGFQTREESVDWGATSLRGHSCGMGTFLIAQAADTVKIASSAQGTTVRIEKTATAA